MTNINYRAIQIPVEAYEKLIKYCTYHDKKIGKTVQTLIEINCKVPITKKLMKSEKLND